MEKKTVYDITICEDGKAVDFFVEESAFLGVRKIADVVAEDVELVTGSRPAITSDVSKIQGTQVIIIGTFGKSKLLDCLVQKGKLSGEGQQKREVYTMQVVNQPFEENKQIASALVIAGSDKRGTIYGMFRLSELCGVSPLVYWGDAAPKKQEKLVIGVEQVMVSKEPSVMYRGFFINDEWPAFGNWCNERFNGINAAAYKKIFELLLRLKGNYLWPAMWNSSFSEDGPGIENARLADEYGVIMGTSHHEPLCRAGVEWQRVYATYGESSAWNFHNNKKAITKFWEDGLKRNRSYENVVTIGMRGESDSKLLSEDATRKDNIELLKDVIRVQHRLIQEQLGEKRSDIPRMLAIYKEVEDYYYGDDTCEGLRRWEELNDVIFLLSDDNFGNLRTLPDEEDKKHPGGFGMYYHFDYHGAPVSYEWVNSIRLEKIWEQMTMAYEYGIQKMWIVNVGDLKGAEYPLSFFMELAYDFEQWGTARQDSAAAFSEQWVEKQFQGFADQKQKKEILEVLNGYIGFNAMRRPEAMNESVYHPVHFDEGTRLYKKAKELLKKADQLREELPQESCGAYESMICYPAAASLNMVLMNLEAGVNQYLAARGSTYANYYAELAKKRIEKDAQLVEEFHSMQQGKWNHMMRSAHTGFYSWDDYDWHYPVLHTVIPVPAGKVILGFAGSDAYSLGKQWFQVEPICNEDFLRADTEEVVIEIDSRGNIDALYQLTCDCDWLSFSETEGYICAKQMARKRIKVHCQREKLKGQEKAILKFYFRFENGEEKEGTLAIAASAGEKNSSDMIAIDAEHYASKTDCLRSGFERIPRIGRTAAGMKCFPVTCDWSKEEKKPSLTYLFSLHHAGTYTVELQLTARNPVRPGGQMKFSCSLNQQKEKPLVTLSEHYYTEWSCKQWNDGVMKQIHVVTMQAECNEGENCLTVFAGEPGIILERILIYPEGTTLPYSYLGPEETCILKKND